MQKRCNSSVLEMEVYLLRIDISIILSSKAYAKKVPHSVIFQQYTREQISTVAQFVISLVMKYGITSVGLSSSGKIKVCIMISKTQYLAFNLGFWWIIFYSYVYM